MALASGKLKVGIGWLYTILCCTVLPYRDGGLGFGDRGGDLSSRNHLAGFAVLGRTEGLLVGWFG